MPRSVIPPTEHLPTSAGVYRFLGENNRLIYVGKAKNLKRRLSQYRRVTRLRRHRKMRAILKEARSVQIQECASEADALLLENQLIQLHRPKWNTVGAFCFLYPSIALRKIDTRVELAWTCRPELLQNQGYELYGSFRSRSRTQSAFQSLAGLLALVGHAENISPRRLEKIFRDPEKSDEAPRQIRLRRLPDLSIASYLLGEADVLLQELSLALLERPAARARAGWVQEALESLQVFFRFETQRLAQARKKTEWPSPFVPQNRRDSMLIEAGMRN